MPPVAGAVKSATFLPSIVSPLSAGSNHAAWREIDVAPGTPRPARAACRCGPGTVPGPVVQRGSAIGSHGFVQRAHGPERPALRLPAEQQLLERRREPHALELRVQREHLVGRRRLARALEQVRRDVVLRDVVDADQLVERRQRRRELRAADRLGVPDRQVRMRAAAVRAVVEAEALREAQRVHVHLPAGGAVRARRLAEDLGVALARAVHLVVRSTRRRRARRRPASGCGPSSGCRSRGRRRARPASRRPPRLPMSGPGQHACRTAACARRSA